MNFSNPTLTPSAFTSSGVAAGVPMTIQGAVNKTIFLVLMMCFAGIYTWGKVTADPTVAPVWILGGCIVGAIMAFTTYFKAEWSATTGSVYAIAEGLALGAVSALYEAQYNGIVMQAILLTVGTLLAMLGLYTTRIIQPTAKFQMIVGAAMGGICLVYMLTFILSFFHVQIPYIHSNGMIGIGFSVLVVAVAALNLINNFGIIEYGAANRSPKYMEWYSAFGLLVTLVWLYLEFLRLLAKLSSRRN